MFVAYVDVRAREPGAGGGVQYLLILAVIALVCQAIDEVLPSTRGLRDWRQ